MSTLKYIWGISKIPPLFAAMGGTFAAFVTFFILLLSYVPLGWVTVVYGGFCAMLLGTMILLRKEQPIMLIAGPVGALVGVPYAYLGTPAPYSFGVFQAFFGFALIVGFFALALKTYHEGSRRGS